VKGEGDFSHFSPLFGWHCPQTALTAPRRAFKFFAA
jgi:hypothetical protein